MTVDDNSPLYMMYRMELAMVIKTLEQAKKTVEEFHALLGLDENAEYGSGDSEPARNFDHLLNKVIHKGENVDSCLEVENPWELIQDVGWKKVSDKLTLKAKEIINALENAPYPVVRDFLEYYGLNY